MPDPTIAVLCCFPFFLGISGSKCDDTYEDRDPNPLDP